MFARLAAGLIGVAILVPLLVWGGVVAVDLVVWAALGVAMFEYGRMAFSPDELQLKLGVGLAATVVFATVLYLPTAALGPVLIGVTLLSFLMVMGSGVSVSVAADRVGRVLLGALWVGGLLAFVAMVRRLDQGMGWIFVLLASTWLGDTGAYFAGRSFGKHRLAPVLSPKKTWEGAIGGFVAAMCGAVLFGWLTGLEIPWYLLALLGGIVDVFGVLGDLAESLLKRSFGVKDSGGILPGHGGILDRVVSLLFAAPVLYLVAVMVLQEAVVVPPLTSFPLP